MLNKYKNYPDLYSEISIIRKRLFRYLLVFTAVGILSWILPWDMICVIISAFCIGFILIALLTAVRQVPQSETDVVMLNRELSEAKEEQYRKVGFVITKTYLLCCRDLDFFIIPLHEIKEIVNCMQESGILYAGSLFPTATYEILLTDGRRIKYSYPAKKCKTVNRAIKDIYKRIRIKIKQIEPLFSICKVKDFSMVNLEAEYNFTGKTDEEKSVVCITENVPDNVIERDDGWRAFRLEGILDFSLIGVLSKISTLLAENNIGIFAISTYNTDYILTKAENYLKAIEVLNKAGYEVE